MKTEIRNGLATTSLLLAFLLGSVLLCSGTAAAQHMARSGAAAGGHRAMSRPVSGRVQYRRADGVFYNGGLGSIYQPGLAGFGVQQLYNNGTYGGAYGSNSLGGLIDPATQWRIAQAERHARGVGRYAGGYYLLDGGGYAYPEDEGDADSGAPPAQQPQVIVVQAPGAQPQDAPPTAEATAQPALPDVGQFTLVLKGGKQIQAVAFTRMKDQIVYITVDGSRRSVAVADLDSAATTSLNEERGTPLQLPL
jgi:hypothetical protein